MAAVILCMVPVTVPKLFGVHIYGVRTGSMTPTYPVGGVVYVVETDASEIRIGDVITYRLGSDMPDLVQTHRVMDITDEGFVTKGDSNNTYDPEPVAAHRLVGRVVFHLPYLDSMLNFLATVAGKCAMIVLFLAAFACFILAELASPGKKGKSGDTEYGKQGRIDPAAGSEVPDSRGRRKSGKVDILQIAGIVLFLGAAVYLGIIFIGYRSSGKEYDVLAERVTDQIDPSLGWSVNSVDTQETEAQTGTDEVTEASDAAEGTALAAALLDAEMTERLRALKSENPETIGWLIFDNGSISYPIMHGADNDYYLHHTFSGRENSSGSIFMEAANTEDFLDYHTIIYGHNMKNGSMFGSLKKFREEGYYEENAFFTVYTLQGVYRYRIFAYYDIPQDGEIYQIYFDDQADYERLQKVMQRRSYKDTGVDVTGADDVLTLTTCSSTGNRFVVNAIRVESRSAE